MELVWVISILASLAIGGLVGFKYRELKNSILKLTQDLQEKMDKKPEKIENKSALLDPYDVAAQARKEHEELMKRINP